MTDQDGSFTLFSEHLPSIIRAPIDERISARVIDWSVLYSAQCKQSLIWIFNRPQPLGVLNDVISPNISGPSTYGSGTGQASARYVTITSHEWEVYSFILYASPLAEAQTASTRSGLASVGSADVTESVNPGYAYIMVPFYTPCLYDDRTKCRKCTRHLNFILVLRTVLTLHSGHAPPSFCITLAACSQDDVRWGWSCGAVDP